MTNAPARAVTLIIMLVVVAAGIVLLLRSDPGRSGHTLEDPVKSDSSVPRHPAAAPTKSTIPASRETLTPTGSVLTGKVIDGFTGEAVGRYDFLLSRLDEWGDLTEVLHETVAHSEGDFSFLISDGSGRHTIRVASARHQPKHLDVHIPAEGLEGLLITVNPGLTVEGIVIDDASELPVSGALVTISGEAALNWQLGYPEYGTCTVTDTAGRFHLPGLPEGKATVAAMHPAYAEGFTHVWPGDRTEVEIRLRKGFCLYGKTFDDHGKPCSGLHFRRRFP
ncbi:MAG: carboxypeptidase-like regulatory domain-containing protein [Planctomycetota bacterium]